MLAFWALCFWLLLLSLPNIILSKRGAFTIFNLGLSLSVGVVLLLTFVYSVCCLFCLQRQGWVLERRRALERSAALVQAFLSSCLISFNVISFQTTGAWVRESNSRICTLKHKRIVSPLRVGEGPLYTCRFMQFPLSVKPSYKRIPVKNNFLLMLSYQYQILKWK